MKRSIVILLASVMLSSFAYAADTLYVQSKKAKLMESPGFSSGVTTVLKRGDKLGVIEKSGAWYRVSARSGKGWINRLVVAEHPPMEKVAVLSDDAERLEKMARRRASAITSAAASRGLSEADRKRLSDKIGADYASLKKLETLSRRITEEEVEAFMKEGEQ